MFKFLIIILIFTGCQGCSFIEEKFGNKQNNPQNQEENQEQQSEPIPTNPQHS